MVVMLNDPDFTRHTYVVIDFEALTPAGRSAEPIEVAAVAVTVRGDELTETERFQALIRPPADVPVTDFDTRQTGITPADLQRAEPASTVLAALDARLTSPPYRLVAHHAPTEAGLIAHQRPHCPTLAATTLLDTVRLARMAYPELSSHRLDELLRFLHLPHPPNRHRAMPDVEATVAVFRRVIADGTAAGHWSTLHDLDKTAGIPPKVSAKADTDEQESLF
ncbi:MAG TPA: 3'-5' exonuclease [Actinomadura sp.]|jgi:DNA polymerase-3 subunit epsilon|nr:3'-5' exonuclease [Actinomadura sp.]